MPSPTSNNTSPSRLVDPAQEFLERERASMEAINAIGGNSRSSSGSQETISKDVAGLAIHRSGSQHSSLDDSPMAEPDDDIIDEYGDHQMIEAATNTNMTNMASMEMDHTLRRESEKIEEWRKKRAATIAAKEEEADRIREETRRQAQSDLADFLRDYQAAIQDRRSRPIDTASFMTEFDGDKRSECSVGGGPNGIDWVRVQKLVKLLPPPANADRFLQIVNSMATKQQS